MAQLKAARSRTRAYEPGHLHPSLPGKRPGSGFKNAMPKHVRRSGLKPSARTPLFAYLTLTVAPFGYLHYHLLLHRAFSAPRSHSDELDFPSCTSQGLEVAFAGHPA
jgi:hypothetical protein